MPCMHCSILAHIKQFVREHTDSGQLPPTEIIVHTSKVMADMLAVYFSMEPVTTLEDRNEFMDELLSLTRRRVEIQFARAVQYNDDCSGDIEH